MAWRHGILIQNHLVALPEPGSGGGIEVPVLATLMSNLAHYGFALSMEAMQVLRATPEASVTQWWTRVEPALKKVTGDDKDYESFVVYKNFPAEVMNMSEAQYWGQQILMYLGFANEWFTEEVKEREALTDKLELKVLHLAQPDALERILHELLQLPARWTDAQHEAVSLLMGEVERVPLEQVRFKENMVLVAKLALERGTPVSVSTATDVMRLAAALSDGDESLRTPVKFRSMTRAQRKFLLGLLEDCKHLQEDLTRRPKVWKKFLYSLHPGDYAERFPKVVRAHDLLARGDLPETFNGRLERYLRARDPRALTELQTRPGEFLRRLHTCLERYEHEAMKAFLVVVPKLKTIQLLKLHRYLETVNGRKYRLFPPRGNWSKLQLREADPARQLHSSVQGDLLACVAAAIRSRVSARVPSVDLDPKTRGIVLQTSDNELTDYGRGTVFPIPDNIRFFRTASYWQSGPTHGNIWFDNGWNFFDADWQELGACCWNQERFAEGALFSGDPTNSKDLKGRACQLIDLYPDKLIKEGVRFAVWNVLAYSRITFADTEEVFAALQWGEEPQKGKLFEPSRCQLSFPLAGDSLTKYVAYLDLAKRELVYLDANLYARTGSAASNGKLLAKVMPAFVEYLDTLPTVHDLFRHLPQSPEGARVAYSDADRAVVDKPAYVFRPVNQESRFERLELAKLL
jgi:hypothetical protein